MEIQHHQLYQSIRIMLRPIVRFCLHRTMKVQDILECLKFALIDVAVEEISRLNEKVNVSKLSVATGLRRREVMRIYREGDHKSWAVGLSTKVIGAWQNDRRFLTKQGKPRVLSLSGQDSEFSRLVRSVSQDVPTASVLFDLERMGAARRTDRGVELCSDGLPGERDLAEACRMLGEDVAALMRTVEENVERHRKVPNLHLRTVFDNIARSDLSALRELILKEGSEFHARLAKLIGKHDLDIRPRKDEVGGGKLTVTSFGVTWE